MNANERMVKDIAKKLDDIANGYLYICPCCGETFDISELSQSEEDNYYCPECDDTILDSFTMYDYLENTLGIEYRVFNKEDDINSVKICIAYGGPNIFIDTEDNKVKLYWYSDYSEYEFSQDVSNEINYVCNEIWNSQ